MIRKSISLSVAECLECHSIMVYSPAAQGLPAVCQKCGLRWDEELTQEKRNQIERMKQQQNSRVHTIRF